MTSLATITLGATLAAALAASTAQAADLHGITAMAGPPAGFDAVHASDAQLNAFALPPRPDAVKTPEAFAKWVRAMSRKTTRVMAPVTDTNIVHGPIKGLRNPRAVANTTTYDSYNWSGAINTNTLTRYNASHSFYYIVSDYVVPTATNASCDGGWDYSSTWDGLDGWSNSDVLQAGTESDAYCNGGSTNTYYSAWVEWAPYSESRISLPVAPGDDMFVEVWDVSATDGYAYVENLNTGVTAEYELTPPAGYSLVGNSAEWIVERPEVSGSFATLSDYALDYQSSGAAYNFNFTQFTPGSSTSVLSDMLDNYGNVISVPSLLGKTAVEYVYQ